MLSLDEVNSTVQISFPLSPTIIKNKLKRCQKYLENKYCVILTHTHDTVNVKINDSQIELNEKDAQNRLNGVKNYILNIPDSNNKDSRNFKSFSPMTHFVNFPLTKIETVEKYEEFQSSVKKISNELSKDTEIFNDPKTVHLTISVLSLDTQEKIDKALEIFKNVEQLILSKVKNNAEILTIDLKGIDTMNSDHQKTKVLFAKVHDSKFNENSKDFTSIITIANEINDMFKSAGLVYKPNERQVKLHATLLKSSNRKKNFLKGKPFDTTKIFDKLENFVFAENLKLKSMLISSVIHPMVNGYFAELAGFDW